jgi:hypothetical protein
MKPTQKYLLLATTILLTSHFHVAYADPFPTDPTPGEIEMPTPGGDGDDTPITPTPGAMDPFPPPSDGNDDDNTDTGHSQSHGWDPNNTGYSSYGFPNTDYRWSGSASTSERPRAEWVASGSDYANDDRFNETDYSSNIDVSGGGQVIDTPQGDTDFENPYGDTTSFTGCPVWNNGC